MDDRHQFLLTMYSEAWRNIERHILVVWQTAGVVGATFAALLLADKVQISEEVQIPFGVAISFELLVVGWLYAHILDAEFWFSRNLHIIRNIERQFLEAADGAQIHYYFLPRASGDGSPSLDHLRIQKYLARAMFMGVFGLYAANVLGSGQMSFSSLLPFVVAVGVVIWLGHFKADRTLKHADLERRSPGRQFEV